MNKSSFRKIFLLKTTRLGSFTKILNNFIEKLKNQAVEINDETGCCSLKKGMVYKVLLFVEQYPLKGS